MSIVIFFPLIVGILTIFTYNRLVVLRTKTKQAWSDIDVQLKRRHDLIPRLIDAVKGYASHEKQVFEKVAEARQRAMEVVKSPGLAAGAEKG